MVQCKAVTVNGTQCQNQAKEGSKYCGIHSVLEVDIRNRYRILVYSVSAMDIPDQGIYSNKTLENRLNQLYNEGYEVYKMELYDRVSKEPDGLPEHFWMTFLLKLRE